MKNKEVLKQELEKEQAELRKLRDELKLEEKPLDNDPHYIEVCNKIDDLYDEIRSVDAPQAPKGLTVGIVLSVIMIVAGFFISKYISFVAIASVIVLCFFRAIYLKKAQNEIDKMQAPSKKKLEALESEYDSMRSKYPRIKILEEDIYTTQRRTSALNEKIAAIENEEIAMKKALGTDNLEQYERNYLFINVGWHGEPSRALRHSLVIDGQDYGVTSQPFSKFEMNPGVHTIILKYQLSDTIYQSKAIQFRADEQTKMIVIKYASGLNLVSKEYTDFCEFLDGISKL